MISPGAFKTSFDESIQFLKKTELYKNRGIKNIGEYSQESKKIAKKNQLSDIYNVAIANYDYEILLFDDSIFQFAINSDGLRFAFIQNPQNFVPQDEFFYQLHSVEDLLGFEEHEIEVLKNSLKDEDYQQFLNEQELNSKSNYFRYDLDMKGYKPLVHSYSHMHIGLNESVRIPCSKVVTPLKFVLFSIKQTYHKQWKHKLESGSITSNEIKKSKEHCSTLSREIWTIEEEYELYLH